MKLAIALLILAFCISFRSALEQDPVTHVLVQLPLLASAGWVFAKFALRRTPALNTFIAADRGVGFLLVAIFAGAFWMLPRSIDAALDNIVVETVKFVSIPLLVGAPLAFGWQHAHILIRGILKANALSMLCVLAFLYTHAPIRICNNYLVSDQERLGVGFLIVALCLTVLWVIPLFLRQDDDRKALLTGNTAG